MYAALPHCGGARLRQKRQVLCGEQQDVYKRQANVHPEYIPDVTKPVEFTFTFRGI